MEQKNYKVNFTKLFVVLFIWIFSILSISIMISSCSAERHLKISDKHIKKAIAKGAKIKVDTAYRYIYDTDTLFNEITNEVHIIRKVVDSIPYSVVNTIYVPMSRQERIKYRDSLSHIRDLYELQTKRLKYIERQKSKQVKQENKTKRKTSPASIIRSLLWLAVACSVLCAIIKHFKN